MYGSMSCVAKYRKRRLAVLATALTATAWMPTAWAEVAPDALPDLQRIEHGDVKIAPDGNQMNIKIGGDGKGIYRGILLILAVMRRLILAAKRAGWC
jgi:hypothetical protein